MRRLPFMPPHESSSLIGLIRPQERRRDSFIADRHHRLSIRDCADKTNLDQPVSVLRDRNVLLASVDQLSTVLALAQLDGVAKRIVICTPDLSTNHLRYAFDDAALDTVVTDGKRIPDGVFADEATVICSIDLQHKAKPVDRTTETEWLLFTSGTTGRPKLVLHTLKTLTGAVGDGVGEGTPPVWSTFYDIRRYGGLQVLLRALAGSGSMVLSDPAEPIGSFLARAGAARVTHISGTPSHWRRVLMSGTVPEMSPCYVRLSGEPADQAILDGLKRAFAGAEVAHAFASTEAGVAFDVRDGKAGFPISLLNADGAVSLRTEDGALCIRSPRTALRYVGADAPALRDGDGYVNTGDILERHGDRYLFVGRRNDIINVGGLKVHPEAVEFVINQHPAVSMSRVSGRPNPITGAIVVADVVFGSESVDEALVKEEIAALCRSHLARHQIPSSLRIVPSLAIAESGKLLRRHA
jgi:acyl-coenzyme A synthetase/AMP-(fatty) acid ligase